VFALGLIVLFASGRILPERLYPWLGFVSGMMIFCVGSWQFIRRVSAKSVGGGAGGAAIDPHGPGGHTHKLPDSISLPGLVALGVSGGIVPCPSALVLLLSAIALHRTGAGLVLIIGFSFGLAFVLILIGMLTLYSQRLLTRWSWDAKLTGPLRMLSSLAVSLLGVGIALQSLRAGSIL
jgi:ABC-type nickel/cobalt efflux system permease component RcnA